MESSKLSRCDFCLSHALRPACCLPAPPSLIAHCVATCFAEPVTAIITITTVTEGNGTVLDNTVVVWCSEIGDGAHRFPPWPVVMAGGRCAGFDPGRYIHYGARVPGVDGEFGGDAVDGDDAHADGVVLEDLAEVVELHLQRLVELDGEDFERGHDHLVVLLGEGAQPRQRAAHIHGQHEARHDRRPGDDALGRRPARAAP